MYNYYICNGLKLQNYCDDLHDDNRMVCIKPKLELQRNNRNMCYVL